MKYHAVAPLDSRPWTPHGLHQGERTWTETNCYADLWIELLHTLELEPMACLGFTVAVDFEGDQWTFFKPSHADLYQLYGVDVQELTIWRALEAHTIEQVQHGRVVLVEVDSFHLPDTAGTDYRTRHAKTTIGIVAIDPDARRLGYFHNAGYFELGGEEYTGIRPSTRPPVACRPMSRSSSWAAGDDYPIPCWSRPRSRSWPVISRACPERIPSRNSPSVFTRT